MRWGIALLVLIAACGSDTPGMRLEILAGNTSAVRIELYIATRACNGCSGKLSPKGVTDKLAGEVWLLDGDAMAGTPNTAATLEGGSYTYNLTAPETGKDLSVAYIVVVGYDAAGKAVALAELKNMVIRHGSAEWYRVTLGPATDQPSSDSVAPPGDRIYVWHRFDATVAACVGVEHADASTVKRIWLVPEDDTDCDAIDLECDEYAYAAMGNVALADANCATNQFKVGTSTTSTCLLGGPACIDGRARDNVCGPVSPHYCFPDAACTATCASNLATCIRNTPVVPRIKCDIPYEMNTGARCANDPTFSHAEVNLGPLMAKPGMPATAATSCTSVGFVEIKFGKPAESPTISNNGIVFTRGPLFQPCGFELAWATGTAGLGTDNIFSMADVGLANGNHMLLPIQLSFTGGNCQATRMSCSVMVSPSDGIAHCAQE